MDLEVHLGYNERDSAVGQFLSRSGKASVGEAAVLDLSLGICRIFLFQFFPCMHKPRVGNKICDESNAKTKMLTT